MAAARTLDRALFVAQQLKRLERDAATARGRRERQRLCKGLGMYGTARHALGDAAAPTRDRDLIVARQTWPNVAWFAAGMQPTRERLRAHLSARRNRIKTRGTRDAERLERRMPTRTRGDA